MSEVGQTAEQYIREMERQVECAANADQCCARYGKLVEVLKEENELLRNALEAAKQEGMKACARGTETAMKGMHVAAQLMEVSAENERLKNALKSLCDAVRDVQDWSGTRMGDELDKAEEVLK